MPSKHPAISNPSCDIALKYGKNVSKGIQEMERRITVLESANKQKAEEIKRMKVICKKYHLV